MHRKVMGFQNLMYSYEFRSHQRGLITSLHYGCNTCPSRAFCETDNNLMQLYVRFSQIE